MLKKKKLVALILVLSMMFALVACGNGGTESASSSSGTQPTSEASQDTGSKETNSEEIKLQLWHIHTSESRKLAIEEAAARFEEANPGVKVEISVLENDPYKTKLRTVMGSGDAPDVFHSWGGGWLKSFVDEGLVLDITEDIKGWEAEVSSAAVEMNTYDGKVWGSPYIVSSTPLYYNKALFEQYNLEFPETYDDLMDVCETFKSNGVIPFGLANLTKWPGAQHFVLLSMRIGGPDIFQRAIDGEISFEDPAFVEAGQKIQDMIDKGYFPDGANALNWDTGDSRQMFYSGQCAMILQTSNLAAACLSENPDFFENNLAVGAYPAVSEKGKSTDILGGENAFSVSTNSKHPEMAVKLVEFMSVDQTFQQSLAEGGAMGAKLNLEAPTPILQQTMDQMANATYLQNFIDQTLTSELSEKHKDTCQALFGKQMTPEEAAAEMQKLYEETK